MNDKYCYCCVLIKYQNKESIRLDKSPVLSGELAMLLLLILLFSPGLLSVPSTREVYDDISLMLTSSPYPSLWWQERQACLAQLSPSLEASLERAWQVLLLLMLLLHSSFGPKLDRFDKHIFPTANSTNCRGQPIKRVLVGGTLRRYYRSRRKLKDQSNIRG